MIAADPRQREAGWHLSYLVVATVLSAVVFGVFVWRPGINGYGRAMFGDMVYGTAHKPFVYRTLLPSTVRLVASAVPANGRARLSEWLGETAAIGNLFTILGWERKYLTEYFIALALMYVCLWGFVGALRYLLSGVYRVSDKVRDLFTVIVLAGLTQFCGYYSSYLYDFPTLLLFMLGLGCLVRARWRAFLLVYVLGCLNKETTILLTLVFLVHFRHRERLSRKLFKGLLLAQLVTFVLIKAGLILVFRNNPGTFVEVHWQDHNLELLRGYSLGTLFGWCGLVLLLAQGWSTKPAFLRDALWIALPLIALTSLFGYLDELRDYYEVYPVVALLALPTIGRITGFEVVSAEAPAGVAGPSG